MINRKNTGGFTITELVLSITVAGFLAAVLFTTTFYYFANVSQSETSSTLALESQNILAQLTEDIRLSDAISATNDITDPYSPGGGWVTSDPSNIIIIENPAVDSSHNIIYDDTTGFPFRNEFIYFASGKNMYKRVLKNPDAVGNIVTQTCPAANSTSGCPPDRLFSSNLSNLTFTFYDALDSSTADPAQARSVLLQVDMSKKVFGKNITLSNSTRVTLRNQ